MDRGSGGGEIAEFYLLDMLADVASKSAILHLGKLVANRCKHLARPGSPWVHNLELRTLYKETDATGQDMFGADAFLLFNQDNTTIALRLQVKYGTRVVDETRANEIIDKFFCNYKNSNDLELQGQPRLLAFRLYLARHGFILGGKFQRGGPGGGTGCMSDEGQRLLLVTTCAITEKAAILLHNRGIHMMAPWVLDEFVWPLSWRNLHYVFLGWTQPNKPPWWKPEFD